MRKVFSFIMVALMSIITLNAAPIGIIVNGKHYFAGTENPAPPVPSVQEYMALGVPLKSGDVLALYDEGSKASWAVTLDQSSTSGISKTSDTQYSCTADGCYDFYINNDQLYVDKGGDGCSDWGEDISVVTEPESVDLGLPSGIKWANMNVGATSPEGCGDYFAWGETEPKENYSKDTYTYTDNPTTLPADHDAATANWGSDWRMPTQADWDELKNTENCTWEWKTNYNGTDVNGYLVTSKKNGNSIFLPASGYRNYSLLNDVGSDGNYWSSSLYEYDSSYAYDLCFYSNGVDSDYISRRLGQSVRPVYDPSEPTALPTLKNADKAPVRKYIKDGRFEMEINGKNYNALGAEF